MPAQNEQVFLLYLMLACLICFCVAMLIVIFFGQFSLIKAVRGLEKATQQNTLATSLLHKDHEQVKEFQIDLRATTGELARNVGRIEKGVYKSATREELKVVELSIMEKINDIDKKVDKHKHAIEKIEAHLYQSTINPENRTSYPKSDLE